MAVFIYGDLLHESELIALGVIGVIALSLGRAVLILRVAAPGHRPAYIAGRRKRILQLYKSIGKARSNAGEVSWSVPVRTRT